MRTRRRLHKRLRLETRDYENSIRYVWSKLPDGWTHAREAWIFTDFHGTDCEDGLIPCLVLTSVPQCPTCGEWAMHQYKLLNEKVDYK